MKNRIHKRKKSQKNSKCIESNVKQPVYIKWENFNFNSDWLGAERERYRENERESERERVK